MGKNEIKLEKNNKSLTIIVTRSHYNVKALSRVAQKFYIIIKQEQYPTLPLTSALSAVPETKIGIVSVEPTPAANNV